MLGVGQIFDSDLPEVLLNHLLVRLSLANMQTISTLLKTNIWAENKRDFYSQALWTRPGNCFKKAR